MTNDDAINPNPTDSHLPAAPQSTQIVTSITGQDVSDLDRRTNEYLEAVAKRWVTLKLEATNPSVALYDGYVMLEVLPAPLSQSQCKSVESPDRLENAGLLSSESDPSQHHPNLAQQQQASEPVLPPQPVALAKALDKALHVVLLGEPGAGKSTTLQFIGLCCARQALGWVPQPLGLSEDRVPLLVRLRDLNSGQTIRDALEEEVRHTLQTNKDDPIVGQLIDYWQRKNRLLILLDGLDEARDAECARRAIDYLASSPLGNQSRIIVTSRCASYDALAGTFREYTLKPLDKPAEAEAFLSRWLNARGKPDTASALLERLRQQPALRRLLDNPLILHLCAEVYARSGEIVRNRTELYQKYVSILEQRAKQRGLDDKTCAELKQVATKLAWHWHNGGANDETATIDFLQQVRVVIDQREVCEATDQQQVRVATDQQQVRVATDQQQVRVATDQQQAEKLLADLRTKLGLIVQVGSRYAFSHQTLREYFVYRRLRQAWDRDARRTFDFLRPRLHLPEWREPLALLVGGLSDDQKAQQLLGWIMRAGSAEERWLKRDLLLAAELVAESGKQAPAGMYRALQRAVKASFTRRAALDVLAAIGDEQALQILLRSLNDDAAALAAALKQIRNPQAVNTIQHILNTSQILGLRKAAIVALGNIGDQQAIAALNKALHDHNNEWQIRKMAAIMLGGLGTLEDKDVHVLLDALCEQNEDERVAAARALEQVLGQEAVPSICRVLRDTCSASSNKSNNMRIAAAVALGVIGDKAVVSDLRGALADNDWRVRKEAIIALGKIGDQTATPDLLKFLADCKVREHAIIALGELGDVEGIKALFQILHDPNADWMLKWQAAMALETIKNPDASDILIGAVNNNHDRNILRVIVLALGNIVNLAKETHVQSIIDILLKTLQHPEWEIRKASLIALQKSGKVHDQRLVHALLEALNDSHWAVRAAAVEALGNIGNVAVIPHLTRALLKALNDSHWGVRSAVAEALGNIGNVEVIPHLTHVLLKAGEVRAAGAAAFVSNMETIPQLMALLANTDRYVNLSVAEALTNLLPRLRNAAPSRDLQRSLAGIYQIACQWRDPALLRAVLLVKEIWHGQHDQWQDPLRPPPARPVRRWLQWIGGAVLAALALIVNALTGSVQEAIGQWLAGWLDQPALLALLAALALLGGGIAWLQQRRRG